MRLHLFLLIGWLGALSCSKNDITPPSFNAEANLVGTTPIKYDVVKQMEGIYALKSGDGSLGVQFVCKISKSRVSFFSNESGIFLILKYGLNPVDSSIQFAGFWRSSESAAQNTVQFSIAKNAGASDLLNHKPFTILELGGLFAEMAGGNQNMVLSFTRAFSSYVRSH